MTPSLTGTAVLVGLIWRRDRGTLALWTVLVGLYPLLLVLGQESVNPAAADRVSYVAAMSGNAGFLMLYGPAYGSSVGALGIWAAGDALWIVALASLLTVVRHTRAEEEAGRRQLLGATVVGRHAGLAAALLVAGAADLGVAVVAAFALMARGLPADGSIAMGLGLAAVGWVFAALAAVAAQVTESASTARGIAVAGLGAAWLLRAAGDAGGPDGAAAGLSWLSPIGWARRVRPFAGERWWILTLAVATAVVLVALAAVLTTRRDIGAGALRPRLGPASASPSLRGPVALAWRLHRGRVVAWAAGLAVLSGVLSASAESAGDLFRTNPAVGRMFALVGGGSGASDVFLSAIMGMFGLLAAAYAVSAALRLRAEEAASRAEPVLANSVGRARWASSHLVFALLGPAVALAAAGLVSGLVYGLSVGDLPAELPRVLAGAMVQVPAVWVLAGLTVALFGLRPRLVWVAWAAMGALGLLWVVAMSVQLSQPVLNLSPFNHVPRLPGDEATMVPLLWLLTITAVLIAVGVVGFRRRDLERA